MLAALICHFVQIFVRGEGFHISAKPTNVYISGKRGDFCFSVWIEAVQGSLSTKYFVNITKKLVDSDANGETEHFIVPFNTSRKKLDQLFGPFMFSPLCGSA